MRIRVFPTNTTEPIRDIRDPRLSSITLSIVLTGSGTDTSRFGAALNPSAPAAALGHALRRDKYASVRWAAAAHPSTPHDALGHALLRDVDADVRREAARNRHTRTAVLQQALASERNGSVRAAIIRRLRAEVGFPLPRRQSVGSLLAA